MNRLKGQNKTHLQWVDNTKLLACALVVLGHFAQSMVRAGILPDTVAYTLCNSALYTFHVPLFFICSAYLYRRFTVLRTCRDYARHVGKKALALGVPYFTFAGANYALKLLFPAGVNMAEERGPVAYFFLNPPAPFWYLPVLFLFFVLIPPAGKKGSLALIFHLRSLSCGHTARLCAQSAAKPDLVCHGTGTGQCACRSIAQKAAAAAVGHRIFIAGRNYLYPAPRQPGAFAAVRTAGLRSGAIRYATVAPGH